METIRLCRTGAELANRRVILLYRGVSYVLMALASITRATSLQSNGLRWGELPSCTKSLDEGPCLSLDPATKRSEMAGGCTALLQVFLVIFLCAVERSGGRDLRRDGPLKFAAGFQGRARFLGGGFLLRRMKG